MQISKIYFLLYDKNCFRFYKLILNLKGLVWLLVSAISRRLLPPHNEWGGAHMKGMTRGALALTCSHATARSTTGVRGV